MHSPQETIVMMEIKNKKKRSNIFTFSTEIFKSRTSKTNRRTVLDRKPDVIPSTWASKSFNDHPNNIRRRTRQKAIRHRKRNITYAHACYIQSALYKNVHKLNKFKGKRVQKSKSTHLHINYERNCNQKDANIE